MLRARLDLLRRGDPADTASLLDLTIYIVDGTEESGRYVVEHGDRRAVFTCRRDLGGAHVLLSALEALGAGHTRL